MTTIRINPDNVWADNEFPFNQAVVEPEGKRVHLTGQVAWDRNGNVIGRNDAGKQTKCAIDNIIKILAGLGGKLDDIVSMTMYYVNDEDLPDIQNERIRRFKKGTGPAVTGVKVAGLVDPELLVELTVMAVIPNERFSEKIKLNDSIQR